MKAILTRLAALSGILALTVSALVAGVPQAAQAAEQVRIDSVSFEESVIPDGSRQELTVAWSVPGQASAPIALSVPLPEGLTGVRDRFELTGPDGKRAGDCVVTGKSVDCSVDDAFIEANPAGVHGEFTFRADVWLENLTETEHIFEFGEITSEVTVTPNPDRCFENCEFDGTSDWKGGWYDNGNDTITWEVSLGAPEDGFTPGLALSATDHLDTDIFELVGGAGNPTVLEARSVAYDRLNREQPVWKPKTSGVTVSPDRLTVSWESVAGAAGEALPEGQRGLSGSVYLVQWQVKVLDEGKAKRYKNRATFTIEGDRTKEVSGTAERYTGSGWVVGKNFGRFRVVKELTGDASFRNAPEFSVNWSAYDTTDGDARVDGGTFKIRAGGDFVSPELFKGTRVVLEEIVPTGPANVTWADPVFLDANGNEASTIEFSAEQGNLGTLTQIRLVNRAELERGVFTAQKKLLNESGIAVPEGQTFSLGYTYPAGDTFPAGEGVLELPADGALVTSPELPVGAELSLRELNPEAVPGATWSTVGLSKSAVTICAQAPIPADSSGGDAGCGAEPVTVEVTNRLTADLGGFRLAKSLSGAGGALVPEGTEFTVAYAYPAGPGFAAGGGEVRVVAGGAPAEVTGLPAGALVTLTEAAPDPITGTTWLDPVFSERTFAVVKDNTITIDLENPISLNTGEFAVQKLLSGSGAELVAPEAEFGVDFTYLAGPGFAAGSGSLVIRGDGVAVGSGPLPFGAVVTLAERDPAAVLGGTWNGHRFSTESVTIGDGTTVAVSLTNEITRDVGAIEIVKSVTGSGADLVEADREFVFDYAYPAGPSFAAGEGAVTVRADGVPVRVENLPADAVVTVTEREPAAVVGGTWQTPRFDRDTSARIATGETAAFAVENELLRNTGSFAVKKLLSGSGAALVSAEHEFTVAYAYPAGPGFEAGEGTLTVRADGVAVRGPELPFGARVTLSERSPAAVAGARWGDATFSVAEFTVGDGETVAVSLTNAVTAEEKLGTTGADGSAWWLAGLGGGLLALGGLLVARKRRVA